LDGCGSVYGREIHVYSAIRHLGRVIAEESESGEHTVVVEASQGQPTTHLHRLSQAQSVLVGVKRGSNRQSLHFLYTDSAEPRRDLHSAASALSLRSRHRVPLQPAILAKPTCSDRFPR
jgi:hypothetical protein